jgi:hypothetical protein
MQFVGIHLNFFNVLKVNVGRFSSQYTYQTSLTSEEPYNNKKEQEQAIDMTSYDRIPINNAIKCVYKDQRLYRNQRHIRVLSTIITYDSTGRINQWFGSKGIYIDCYV